MQPPLRNSARMQATYYRALGRALREHREPEPGEVEGQEQEALEPEVLELEQEAQGVLEPGWGQEGLGPAVPEPVLGLLPRGRHRQRRQRALRQPHRLRATNGKKARLPSVQ